MDHKLNHLEKGNKQDSYSYYKILYAIRKALKESKNKLTMSSLNTTLWKYFESI